jgi:hypothetical protein
MWSFITRGTFRPSESQPTIDFGSGYKIQSPVILLLMAGRSGEPACSNQSYFVGYFGLKILLPPKEVLQLQCAQPRFCSVSH